MAKRESAIKRVGTVLPTAPGFMDGNKEAGTESLRSYIIPPRIKIIQKQVLDSELAALFGEGDVVTVPDKTMVCEMPRNRQGKPSDESPGFLFVPLFFYPEWCQWNPISMRGSAPAIRERSCDPASELARKSRSPELRMEPHPTDPTAQIRNVEHLNFLVAIQGADLMDVPPILTFARGSYMRGSAFCSLIHSRKAPIYGSVFQANLVHEQNEKGDWWSLAVTNPSGKESPWITDKKTYEEYRTIHEGLVEAHRNANIRVDYEDAPEALPVSDGAF